MSRRKYKRDSPAPSATETMQKNRSKLQKLFADRNADNRPNVCQGPRCSATSLTTEVFQVDRYKFCEACASRYNDAKESKREKARKAAEARAGLGWGEW